MGSNGLMKLPKSLLEEIEKTLGKSNIDSLSLDKVIENIVCYYENIIGCMPGNVYWLDKHGITLGCNKNVLNMFGLNSLAQFKGLTFEEMGEIGNWAPAATQAFKQDTLEVIKTGRPKLNIEEPPISHHDGQMIYFLTHRVPLFDSKRNVIGVVGISIDITERKNMEISLLKAKEAAEAADKAKTEFLMNMRHDLRTPLSGIIGFAGLIKNEAKDSTIYEYADNMLASSQALLDFLNEILETIKITSGEMPIIKKKFNLKEKIIPVITLHRTLAKQKNILLTFDYDERLPKYLFGDGKRIQRIILELVSNALNFTHKGEVKIKIALARKENHETIFKLIVSDTGIGIPEDKLNEVFARFTRLTSSYEGIYKGIGVGLTIIKQFIDDLEGEIYVDSVLGKGTTFTCVFCFKEALLEEEQGVDQINEIMRLKIPTFNDTSLSVLQNVQAKGADISILLVEDSPIAALVAKRILTNLGCQVEVAADGQSAITRAKMQVYDGIFMDVGLPDISGNEVTRAFRAWEADRHTPIIALTAHIETEEKQSCIEAGMDAVLSKPLTQEKAGNILAAFIPKYAAKVLSLKPPDSLESKPEDSLPILTGKAINLELATQFSGSSELARETLNLLIDLIPIERDKIVAAYESKNWIELQEIAHKFKGSSTYCGATRLAEISTSFQAYLKTGKTELRDKFFYRLLEEIDLVQEEFSQIVKI